MLFLSQEQCYAILLKMETTECIRSRRTIRHYQNKPVPQVIIDKLIESAKYAPSSDDSQSWEFIVITTNKIKERLSELTQWSRHIKDSPVAIAVLGNTDLCKDDFLNAINSSLAMQNLMLEAHNQGLGSCCTAIIDKDFEAEEKARSILKIPENILLYCIITLGYPDEKPKLKQLREDIIHYDNYT